MGKVSEAARADISLPTSVLVLNACSWMNLRSGQLYESGEGPESFTPKVHDTSHSEPADMGYILYSLTFTFFILATGESLRGVSPKQSASSANVNACQLST